MFRPSAAPRWNNTTSRFFPVPAVAVSAAYTARVRKLGMTLVPTTASAPPFRKTLRVIDINAAPKKSNMNHSRPRLCFRKHPQARAPALHKSYLSSLKLGRSHNQSSNGAVIRFLGRIIQFALCDLGIVQLLLHHRVRLR